MELNIILLDKDLDKCLNGRRLVNSNDTEFNLLWKPEWAQDLFIKEVLYTIDSVTTKDGKLFYNEKFKEYHAKEALSTGCKTVILIYKRPDTIYRTRFGNNCAEFIEHIAANRDVTLYSHYTHVYPFLHIDEINFINWNTTVEDMDELYHFYMQIQHEHQKQRERKEVHK